jgi:hypothetical protein
MSKRETKRVGGLKGIDPAVAAWQKGAATNEAALTNRQRYERARVRVRIDVPEAVAQGLEREAATWETSQSQLGAFLLGWALFQLHSGDTELAGIVEGARTWSKAINVKYDLTLPESVLAAD